MSGRIVVRAGGFVEQRLREFKETTEKEFDMVQQLYAECFPEAESKPEF